MIGVAVVPVWQRHGSRPAAADQFDDGSQMIRGRADGAIGKPQVLAPCGAEHLPSLFSFLQAIFRCAVARHLSARQIAESDRVTFGGVLGQRPAKTDLQIVWVRAEREEIDLRDLLSHFLIRAGPHPRALPSLTLRILGRTMICLVIIL
jgi:hypothetical protein